MEYRSRILLLEDEALLRSMLGIALSTQGHEVMTAGSVPVGEYLIRILGWRWPDLVICDADMDRAPQARFGYAFLARWCARFPVPPFIFMHSDRDFSTVPRERDYRVCHILKPFAPSDLLLLIRAILAK